MTIQISLPDTLQDFLQDQMQQRGLASLDALANQKTQRVTVAIVHEA